MKDSYNIYCDESCHLEWDESDVMVLGAIVCQNQYKSKIYSDIRAIKMRHGLSTWFETKWTKISLSKIEFYLDIVDYFFNNDNLNFRGVVATSKKSLDHEHYNQGSYDLWYYKMYFILLDQMILPPDEYRIFIDIKDTRGGPKIKELHKVLCNSNNDFKHNIIKDIRQINSCESEIMQLTDMFIGALSYYNRGIYFDKNANLGKKEVINRIIGRRSIDLTRSTYRLEKKFNIFVWCPRGCN